VIVVEAIAGAGVQRLQRDADEPATAGRRRCSFTLATLDSGTACAGDVDRSRECALEPGSMLETQPSREWNRGLDKGR
jgi:hypothetical protein